MHNDTLLMACHARRWLEELRKGLQGLWVADWAAPEGSTQVVDSVMDVVVNLQTRTRELLQGTHAYMHTC
jgi:hypothetical protein